METDKVEILLSDMRSYLRSIAAGTVRATSGQVIDSYEKALVYEKLNGETTQTSLEQTNKVSQATLSGWLGKFTEAGLASPPDETHRNHKALFTLAELGINLTTLKKRAKPTVQTGGRDVTVIQETR